MKFCWAVVIFTVLRNKFQPKVIKRFSSIPSSKAMHMHGFTFCRRFCKAKHIHSITKINGLSGAAGISTALIGLPRSPP